MIDQIGPGNVTAIIKTRRLSEKDAKGGKQKRDEPAEDPPQKKRENDHLGVNVDERC